MGWLLAGILALGGLLRWHGLFDALNGHYADQRRSYYIAQGLTTEEYLDATIVGYTDIHRPLHLGTGEALYLHNARRTCMPCWPADWHGQHSLLDVARRTVADNGNSVLFNWGLAAWLNWFGNNLHSARLFAWVWGIVFVLGVGLLGWQFGLSRWGIAVAMFWAAVHPLLIHHSQSHRALIMSMALTALGTAYLLWLLRGGRAWWHWVVLGWLAAAILLTYYVAAVAVAAWLWWLVPQWRDRSLWRHLVIAAASGALPLVCWFAWGGVAGTEVMAVQAQRWQVLKYMWDGDWGNLYAAPMTWLTYGVTQVQAFVFYLGSPLQAWGYGLGYHVPVLLAISGALIWLGRRQGWPVWRLTGAAATPIVLLSLAALKSDNTLITTHKYSILGAVFVATLVGLAATSLWNLPGRFRWTMNGLVVILLALPAYASMHRLWAPMPAKTEYPEVLAARLIQQQHQPGDTILARTWDIAAVLAVHLPDSRDPAQVPAIRQTDRTIGDIVRRRPGQPDSLIMNLPNPWWPYDDE